MKTEICYHFYKTKTVLSKPEYLYFPTVQLQNYFIQDLPPKKPLWFPPHYCSQGNCWHWFLTCLILQSCLFLCNPAICRHEHELDPHGFILDAHMTKQENTVLFKKRLWPTCAVTQPWIPGADTAGRSLCGTASAVKCFNPFGTSQTPPCLSRYGSFLSL